MEEAEDEEFRRSRTTKEQALKQQKKIFQCQYCPKSYLSYPALYTHSKTKHSQCPISSKGQEENADHVPVKKLKSILNENKSPREEVERDLLKRCKVCSLEMFKVLKRSFCIEAKDTFVGDLESPIILKIVEESSLIAEECAFPRGLIDEGIKSKVFKEQETRISKVSFGGQILKFFAKTEIASKVYLAMLLVDERGSEKEKVSQKLWGRKIHLEWLYSEWEEWKKDIYKLQELNTASE